MVGRRRKPWLSLAGAMLIALCLPASALSAPTVTLDSPTNGSVVTTSQPSFSGTASISLTASPQVTVRVYAGASASGTPFETLPPTTRDPATGSYSVAASPSLPDGTYTVQAEQGELTSPVTTPGLSAAVTFTVNTTPPHVVLDSPGSQPLRTATPTLRGTAGTSAGDTRSVAVALFEGASASGSPTRFLNATVAAGGAFSVTVAPGLQDGRYTAVAGQRGAAGSSLSNPVTFRIKVHPPALTLTDPAPGAKVPTPQPTFGGAAGANPGDAASVAVVLHAGSSSTGRDLGHHTVAVSRGRWTIRWPRRLAPGVYTLVMAQGDDAGHTTTVITTFLVVPAPQVIGPRITLSGSRASVPIACTAPSGTSCRGTVLVVTTRRLQARPGGPVGPVRLLFAYVAIPAGHTQSVSGSLPADIAVALRRVPHLQVRVTVSFASLARISAIRTVS